MTNLLLSEVPFGTPLVVTPVSVGRSLAEGDDRLLKIVGMLDRIEVLGIKVSRYKQIIICIDNSSKEAFDKS